jgi:uncharacterized phage protein gp47/JayE
MTPSFADFIPVRRETLATIRPRVDTDANAGIDPTSDRYIDLTPGGFYWDVTQAILLEVERLWDMASTEVPAVAFLTYAWGEYLDLHGEVLNRPRKEATKASGTVTFTGDEGTVIGTGVQVGTAQVDPEQDPVVVATTESGTIPVAGTLDLAVEALESGAAGNVAANTLTQVLTPIAGATGVTATNAQALLGGQEVESDELYRARLLLEFAGTQGAGTTADYERWALAYTGVGFVTVEPNWQGPGTVRVVVMDSGNDPVPASVVEGLQAQLDPWAASTTLAGDTTFPTATVTVASTADFATSGRFYVGGNAVSYTGKTATTFTGCTGGTGTVLAGSAVTQGGSGEGLAPIGAEVLVATGSVVAINVVATVVHRTGYSLDGAGGTGATRGAIEAALATYIDRLPPGEDVILNHVEAVFFRVEGVYNVTGLTLNGSAADVALSPLQVAQLGTVTLT